MVTLYKVFSTRTIRVYHSHHRCLPTTLHVLSNNFIPMSDIFILKSSREDLENSLHEIIIQHLTTIRKQRFKSPL